MILDRHAPFHLHHVQITVGSVGLDGRVSWRAHVRSKRLCMMHDFGITETRIILFDCPMVRRRGSVAIVSSATCLPQAFWRQDSWKNSASAHTFYCCYDEAFLNSLQTFGLARSAAGGHPFEFKHGEPIFFGVLPRSDAEKSDALKPAEVCSLGETCALLQSCRWLRGSL